MREESLDRGRVLGEGGEWLLSPSHTIRLLPPTPFFLTFILPKENLKPLYTALLSALNTPLDFYIYSEGTNYSCESERGERSLEWPAQPQLGVTVSDRTKGRLQFWVRSSFGSTHTQELTQKTINSEMRGCHDQA